jgi:hypothetical protein
LIIKRQKTNRIKKNDKPKYIQNKIEKIDM